MHIGILSDSHGKNDRLTRAADLLVAQGAEVIVHCGDLCDEDALHRLGRLHVPVYAVAGNMDKDLLKQLRLAAEFSRVAFFSEVVTVALGDGRQLAATHGHLEELLSGLVEGGQFAYVCHGHTHRRRDERIGSARVLNPGSLHKPKDRPDAGCLLLDTASDAVEWFNLE
jgi:uncharacterized protein